MYLEWRVKAGAQRLMKTGRSWARSGGVLSVLQRMLVFISQAFQSHQKCLKNQKMF